MLLAKAEDKRQTVREREREREGGRDGPESYKGAVIWKKVVLHTYTCRTNETHSFNEFYCVQLNVKKNKHPMQTVLQQAGTFVMKDYMEIHQGG